MFNAIIPIPRQTIHKKVVIIGHDMTAYLMHGFLNELDIDTILFQSESLERKQIDIDEELSDLSKKMNNDQLLKHLIGAHHGLKQFIHKINGNDAIVELAPRLYYNHPNQNTIKGFTYGDGLFLYQTGLVLNENHLINTMHQYYQIKNWPIVVGELLTSLAIEEMIQLWTPTYHLMCDYLIVTDPKLFREDCDGPFIGTLNHLPNVYFNIGSYSLFNGFIGNDYIKHLLIRKELFTVESFKFSSG